MSNNQSFIGLYATSFRENWLHSALTDYKGVSYTYGDVALHIAKLHTIFKEYGIKPGDHIAICGRNSSRWGISFLAIMTYGAVAVPILHEFKEENVHHIVTDSDSRLLFVGESNRKQLNYDEMPNLEAVVRIEDFSLDMSRNSKLDEIFANLEKIFAAHYPDGYTSSHIKYHND